MINNKIYILKCIDIGFSLFLYLICLFIIVKILNLLFINYSDYDNYSKFKLFILLFIRLWIISVFGYILRNNLLKINFPLDNLYGYKHKDLKEINTSMFLFPLIGLFDVNLKNNALKLISIL